MYQIHIRVVHWAWAENTGRSDFVWPVILRTYGPGSRVRREELVQKRETEFERILSETRLALFVLFFLTLLLQFLFCLSRLCSAVLSEESCWRRRSRDADISGSEYIPTFELYLRNQGTQDGEGHLRCRSSCSYESQVYSFSQFSSFSLFP